MKLEIIIPAYNCAATLPRTLESLVAQTNKNFTVLIVDDCSTESITSIVEAYSNQLAIQYIKNEVNLGCGMTRQRGLDSTAADYISFLDSDDILFPNAIELWLNEISQNHPEVIYSPFYFVTDSNIQLRQDGLFMCHGKVYNVDFLRKYDIRETPEVVCIDDGYFNWQVFDLAKTITFMPEPTHAQINTKGSVTHTSRFFRNLLSDIPRASKLAREKIIRYKDNPFDEFSTIQKGIKEMLQQNEAYYNSLINTVGGLVATYSKTI